MLYPLDTRNTKKTKTKMLSFYKKKTIVFQSNCFKKSQNNNIIFYEKFQK